MVIIPGVSESLHLKTLQLHGAGVATGTQRNRDRQALRYVKHMVDNTLDPRRPTPYDLATYIASLALVHSLSPPVVANYISGARTWVIRAGGTSEAFDSPIVRQCVAGVARSSTHVPRPVPPLLPEDIRIIADYAGNGGPEGTVIRAAVLLGYFTMVRQSNLLAPDGSTLPGPHTIRRMDVSSTPGGLEVAVRSSKTIKTLRDAVARTVPRAAHPYCPVEAWARMVALVPAPPTAPAFVLPSGRPLTPAPVQRVIRRALVRVGHPQAQRMTLHALRRGGGGPRRHRRRTARWRRSGLRGSGKARGCTPTSPAARRTRLRGL
jgi:integrase